MEADLNLMSLLSLSAVTLHGFSVVHQDSIEQNGRDEQIHSREIPGRA